MSNIITRSNGKLCLVKNHSADNAELAGLTLANHWEYAWRHGYDVQIFVEPWESAKWGLLDWVAATLERYEHVFCVGSDVIFTNLDIALMAFYAPEYGAVVSTEETGWSPINNDTLLIHNNAKGREYLDYLRLHAPTFEHAYLQQQLTVNLMYERQDLVVAKPIQSIPLLDSPARWKPGDFCLHFLSGGYPEGKTAAVRRFMETGEVTWHPQRTPPESPGAPS